MKRIILASMLLASQSLWAADLNLLQDLLRSPRYQGDITKHVLLKCVRSEKFENANADVCVALYEKYEKVLAQAGF